MPTLSRSRAAGATLLATAGLAVAGAPSASAAEASVTGRCFVYWPSQGSQKIPITLSGLTAGQNVKVSLVVKKQVVGGIPSLTADTAGGLITSIDAWTSGLKSGPTRSTPASIVVNDIASGAEVAKADFKVANVGFKVDGAFKRERNRSWEISGLASVGEGLGGGKVYYAYYFKNDKQVAKQRLGKSQDACGYIKVKKPLLPIRKKGSFDVKIQASTTWKGNDLPWIGGVVTAR